MKRLVLELFLAYTFLFPVLVVTSYILGMKNICITFTKAYIVISILFWVFIKNLYNLTKRHIIIILLLLLFVPLSFLISEVLGRILSISILFFLGRFESILLLIPFVEVNILLTLYFIGTDIVYSPKMLNNPKVILITALGSLLYFISKWITLAFILAVIFSMIYKTLKKFKEYHRHSLLIILFTFLIPTICCIYNLQSAWIALSMAVLIPNVVLLESLVRRGWIIARRIRGNELVLAMYFSLLIEIICVITNFRALFYIPTAFLALIFLSQF